MEIFEGKNRLGEIESNGQSFFLSVVKLTAIGGAGNPIYTLSVTRDAVDGVVIANASMSITEETGLLMTAQKSVDNALEELNRELAAALDGEVENPESFIAQVEQKLANLKLLLEDSNLVVK